MIDWLIAHWREIVVIIVITGVPTFFVVCACMRSSQISQWEENERWGR